MTDIDPLAKVAYERGYHPIAFAEMKVKVLIDAHSNVITGRAVNPDAFPDFPVELTSSALASRIVGELLDAGWTAPGELLNLSERPS
ncbi:hypothetical protein ACFQVD_26725 [Streptosporangium amethystogenes subsp. fukuiense]|uniref:Uncharacterized protein n=1 Tax=Streptosporangium amethystogenes subsp. fukuiense TaxID=698418 RepID=A0ABW2T7M4_9ACTN